MAGCRPCSFNCAKRRAACACSALGETIVPSVRARAAGVGRGGVGIRTAVLRASVRASEASSLQLCRDGTASASCQSSVDDGLTVAVVGMIGGGTGALGGEDSSIKRRNVSSRLNPPCGPPGAGCGLPSGAGPASFSWRRFISQLEIKPTTMNTATNHGWSNNPAANNEFIGAITKGYFFAPGVPGEDGSGPSLAMLSRMAVSACTFLMR